MSEFYIERENSSLIEYGIEFFLQSHAAKGYTTRSHIHPAIEMIYILNGEYLVSIDNNETLAEGGNLLFFRANTIHSIRLIGDDPGSYYVLKINPSLLFHIFPGKDQMRMTSPFLLKTPSDRSLFVGAEIPQRFKDVFSQMIDAMSSNESLFFAKERALASILLLEVLTSMLPDCKNNSEITAKNISLIYECIDHINKNYASDITAEECADILHISYSYFARLFKTVMGQTFREYLVSVRLAKARSILLSTSISVTDVALSCGYTNLSYFVAEYKKKFGITPKQARKDILSQ